MSHATNVTKLSAGTRSDAPVRTGNPFFDMLFSMQKASQQALTVYGAPSQKQSTGTASQQSTNAVEVMSVGEEVLNVGARTVQGNTVRLRRVVVETPVEKQVSLREEKVIVERRKPTAASQGQDVLTEKAVEMNNTFEVVDTWKSVHLLEEVVLRKEVTERTETVRDTVRRDDVQVEQPTSKALVRHVKA
ncbi:YsnF/AvaK domain-containing protein [Dankookia sp. GCM10030260]|uniref:YsnF/AvaK domain-containing protein n=1 Tax=Dankookia sp. GCM10030260 TaxID=3273390 RepID=UPI00361097DD